MAGMLIVMVMMCVYTIRMEVSGYIQGVCGGKSLLLTLGPGVANLAISHPEHVSTISK